MDEDAADDNSFYLCGMTEELLYVMREEIGWITFNRPRQRNALTFAMYEGLAEICSQVSRTREVKALIVTGAGEEAFAAGTDIAQFRDFKDGEDGIAYERKMDRVLDTVERCSVPTIAAIAGFCTGGGAAIAAACDLRIAAENARFGFPIARTLGNCLSMANYARLAALIGPQRTKELLFLAKMIDGPTAQKLGLVSELLADGPALRARAAELAGTLAGHAPLTLQVTKEALRRLQARWIEQKGTDENIDDLIRLAYGSNDFREGMSAFLGKRAPKWTGT